MFRPFAHLPTACCCAFLKVVAQNLKLVKLLSQQLPTFPLFRDRRSVAQQCLIRCTALPTFLGLRTCITYAHQSLMGFILHMMHCSSNIAGSCCIRLYTTTNTDATAPNNVGSCCVRLHVALLIPKLEIPNS